MVCDNWHKYCEDKFPDRILKVLQTFPMFRFFHLDHSPTDLEHLTAPVVVKTDLGRQASQRRRRSAEGQKPPDPNVSGDQTLITPALLVTGLARCRIDPSTQPH